jgi:AcrR family transcriptional regulator
VRREGAGVPLATIAADAGVGVGTLYRHFPSREALLSALTHRSFLVVLSAAIRAADSGNTPINSLRRFIEETIEHGAELVLPLHGGPVHLDEDTVALRDKVHETLGKMVSQGQQDGSIRPDISAYDIIIFGALLAQQLPHIRDWKLAARREAAIYFDGLCGTKAESSLPISTNRSQRLRTIPPRPSE